MSEEGRLALLEQRLHDLVSRSLVEDCVRKYVCQSEGALIDEILACDRFIERNRDRGLSEPCCQPQCSSTTIKKCEINGDTASVESLRIGVYLREGADEGSVIALSLRDTLFRRAGAWQVAHRLANVQAALAGRIFAYETSAGPGRIRFDTGVSYRS